MFFNEAIESSKFPSLLKQLNITPNFNKGSRNQKENYRPVTILPIISKIFENISSKQLYIYFENIFSEFQRGFRKRFSTQHCLLLMTEKWKEAVDKNQSFGALVTDLSEAFERLSHYSLIVKLLSYGISLASLKLLRRKQKAKAENKSKNVL